MHMYNFKYVHINENISRVACDVNFTVLNYSKPFIINRKKLFVFKSNANVETLPKALASSLTRVTRFHNPRPVSGSFRVRVFSFPHYEALRLVPVSL